MYFFDLQLKRFRKWIIIAVFLCQFGLYSAVIQCLECTTVVELLPIRTKVHGINMFVSIVALPLTWHLECYYFIYISKRKKKSNTNSASMPTLYLPYVRVVHDMWRRRMLICQRQFLLLPTLKSVSIYYQYFWGLAMTHFSFETHKVPKLGQ